MRSAFQVTAQETTRLRTFFLAQAHAFISEHAFCSEKKRVKVCFLLGVCGGINIISTVLKSQTQVTNV